MTGNILGERFVIVSFGESHGPCVGVVIDGCPAGLAITEEEIQEELDKRRPGQSVLTTQRKEEDKVVILSGIFNGRTTGAPICMLVWNRDVDSSPYERIRNTPRPGHADYVAHVKYGGFNDWRGGGRFSARITAGFVMAGAVAKKLLKTTLGVEVFAYTKEIGGIECRELPLDVIREKRYSNEVRCPDEERAEEMRRLILRMRGEGDSVGGVVECIATNLPVGLGEPVFGSLDSELAKALFSIPAVKGVEFGAGFKAAKMRGSEHNDQYALVDGRVITRTNNAGGILGGISNGMPLLVRVVFKPTSSIPKPQKTVDLKTMQEREITITGRHDPCVVPRAVPIVEAMVAITLADHAIRAGFIKSVIQ